MLFLFSNFVLFQIIRIAQVYSEPSRTFAMELLARLVKRFQLSSIFIKTSILDIRLGVEYAPE